MNNDIDLNEYLGRLRIIERVFVTPHGQSIDEGVVSRVIDNLLILIPSGIHVDQASAIIFGFAVRQLCLAKTVGDIDWAGIINLAANVKSLWDSNSQK